MEGIDLVVDIVEGVVKVLDLAIWVLRANLLLTLTQFILHALESLVLLSQQVRLELLDLFRRVIHLHDKLDFRIDLGLVLDEPIVVLAHVVLRQKLLDRLLQLLLVHGL